MMTPDRWAHLQALFHDAMAQPPADRPAFLDAACAGDEALRAELEALLDAHARPGPVDALADALIGPLAAGTAHAPPSEIGPYRIVELIGEGGMGAVYRAARADGQFEQEVALKLLRRGPAQAEAVRRFLDERQILARLNHPHIARLYDGGVTAGGQPYFAMELVDGQPIDAYCDDERLGIDQRLQLFMDVCAALQHAHQNLVVHRDLKPSNILVVPGGASRSASAGTRGAVKLLDFGIAKLLAPAPSDSATPRTRTGAPLMTPGYASPEQVRGAPVTTASDVYALGVLLYELLTGRRPHDLRGCSPSELEHVICETTPLRPSTVVVQLTSDAPGEAPAGPARWLPPEQLQQRLSGDLDTIVLKAMHKDPARRYASAEQLQRDIERHLQGLPVQARPDTWRYRTVKFVRRHRAGVAAAALLLVALLAGIAGTTWQARRAAEQAQLAAAQRDRAQAAAANAEAVSAFLVDLFKVNDPGEAQGATLTAEDLLARGAARIDTELDGQPAVQATMMDVMGQVYRNRGAYDKAQGLLERALALRQETLGPAHVDLAESLTSLGILLHYQGRFDAAEPRYRAALAMRHRLHGDTHEDVASALNNLGSLFHHQGQLDSAETYYRRALAMRQALGQEATAEGAVNLANVAMVRKSKGDYATADSLLRRTLAIERPLLGDTHPGLANTLNNLGTTLVARNELDEAETVLREALAIRRTVLPPEHPRIAESLNNLAATLERKGALAEAETLYRESLTLKRKTLGEEHPSIATTLNNLGLVLQGQEKYAAAQPLLEESLALRRAVHSERHPRVATALYNLASLYHDLQALNRAEPLYRDALALRRDALGSDHPRTATAALGLARLLHARGNATAAEPLFRDALRAYHHALPESHPQIAQTQSHLASALVSLRQFEEAEVLLQASQAVLVDGPPYTEAARHVLRTFSDLYTAWNRPGAAARYQSLLAAAP